VTELAPLALLPISVVDRKVLHPMCLHVGGTVLAAALAVARGWAVNLGGGMHHAHREDGGGW
jgi:histone deacetylase 11